MKNYYEILEVDKKASPEVIEKAYRTLVKKYHPDLQENEKQKEYEEKMKEINEAYSVLTDDYKRATYDEQLQNTTISISEYKKVLQENEELRKKIEEILSETRNSNQTNNNVNQDDQNNYQNGNTISNMARIMQEEIRQATKQAYNNAYRDAYVEDMKNRGYKIRYKHDFKYYVRFVGCILVVILAFALIAQIPIVKRFLINLYEENVIIKAVINILKNTFAT